MLSHVVVRRGRRIAVWSGLAGLAFAVGVIGFVLQANGLQDAANVTQLVALVVLVPSMAKGLFDWARQPRVDTRKVTEQDADRFAGAVADQWRTEAERRSLQHPYPMPVRWRRAEHPDAMDLLEGDFGDGTDDIDELADRYLRLPARRLVVLGGPGAGKTTLAVRLLLALLRKRAPGEPVPVLVSLTGWGQQAEAADWLTDRLRQDYPQFNAEALVKARLVVPVLDGFDELPAPARTAVLDHLNEAMHQVGPLVLTSRTDEYLAAVLAGNDVLAGAAVIEPEPLTAATAVAYLRAALRPPPGPKWDDVMAALDGPTPPAALAEIASTPLGLWLLRVAGKQQTNPETLLTFETAAALRQHLFTMLIPAVVKERPPDPNEPFRPRHRLDPVKARTWLETVAVEVEQQVTPIPRFQAVLGANRDFRWWELAKNVLPRWLLPRWMMTAGLVLGALWGVLAALGAQTMPPTDDPVPTVGTNALVFGILGLVLGAVSATTVNRLRFNQPSTAALRSVRQWLGFLMFLAGGVAAGAAGGVAFQLVLGLVYRVWRWLFSSAPPSWLATDFDLAATPNVLLLGGVVGVGLALMAWRMSTSVRSGNTPVASLAADQDATLARIGTYTVVGALLGLPADAAHWHVDSATYSILLWALLGLAVAVFTERGPWFGYVAATAYLARRGRAPRRLMTFLDDAHRLGLLRTIGPLYQFRHAELQDHLAAPHRTPPPSPPTEAEPRRSSYGISVAGGAGVGVTVTAGTILIFDPPGDVTDLITYVVVLAGGLVAITFAVRAYLRQR